MTNPVPRIAIADRPRFAAKMVAVWRWHHMAKGENLSVAVMPGEWPADVAWEVKGVPVVEDDRLGGPGGVLVLGRVGDVWRAAYNLAMQPWFDSRCTPQDLAIATAFMEVEDDRSMKLWLHPDPTTGEVPMWQVPAREAK